ncbi:type 4a pilus biogenesis protein PilO [Fodinisporobacter ferrooxydans]|uniref:Type 4a pilus biogenesis protein PilO n=1 Tax=Fodinisporobacter ferrooxydans TaxID=2901836 RepID=A0ABY4CQP9_9BACL|nr:type 4a pilus biogenesis protein PilO [Alicyclobacillaceae bacterium MYW30-H2]
MKAVFNNLKLAIFVYLFVLLICTLLFVYVPKRLQSQVETLQQSVQSKQLLVNALRSQPQKKEFVMPKDAQTLLQQLPSDPQVDRLLVQLNDLFNQTGVQFESISLQNGSDSQSTNEVQRLLNGATGQGKQSQPSNQQQNKQQTANGTAQKNSNANDSQNVKSVTFNLSLNGAYYPMLDFLYQLVHTERLLHVDSIHISHQQGAAASNYPQFSVPSSSVQQAPAQRNSQTSNQPQKQPAQPGNTNGNSPNANSAKLQSSQGQATINPILQSLLANAMRSPNQIQSSQNGAGLPNTQPFLPAAEPNIDNVSVTMTLTAFYMPDASFLGSLPEIPIYPSQQRKNPFVP